MGSRTAAALATLVIVASSGASDAGESPRSNVLPLRVGLYAPGTPAEAARDGEDCGGAIGMGWTGHSFEADYIYIDSVVAVRRMPDRRTYHLTATTDVDDANTQLNGKIWLADVRIVGAGEFWFRQYAATEHATSGSFQHFSFCRP